MTSSSAIARGRLQGLMAGVKRKAEDMSNSERSSPYVPMFEKFRAELDEHYDRRERIIKASRDFTAQSKKIIFALQRARELGRPIHASITKQTGPFYTSIRGLMDTIVPELEGVNAHRYQYNVSPGIQEYMEAVLFEHYLVTQCLMSYEAAAAQLPDGLILTYEDYLLGIFDMTGELMRFAVTYMATNGRLPGETESANDSILVDMQALRSQLEGLDAAKNRGLKEMESKLRVTKQSVEKVENSVYSMLVRGKERPKGWRPDTEAPRQEEIEGF